MGPGSEDGGALRQHGRALEVSQGTDAMGPGHKAQEGGGGDGASRIPVDRAKNANPFNALQNNERHKSSALKPPVCLIPPRRGPGIPMLRDPSVGGASGKALRAPPARGLLDNDRAERRALWKR